MFVISSQPASLQPVLRSVNNQRVKLNPSDLSADMRPQLFIPGGTLHTSRLGPASSYSLLGTTAWPGVEAPDVEVQKPIGFLQFAKAITAKGIFFRLVKGCVAAERLRPHSIGVIGGEDFLGPDCHDDSLKRLARSPENLPVEIHPTPTTGRSCPGLGPISVNLRKILQ